MSFGLRVWNEAGEITMNLSTRLTSYVGVFTATAINSMEYLISIPGFTLDGTWAIYVHNFFVSHHPVNGGVIIRGPNRYNTPTAFNSNLRVYVFRC